MLKITNKIKTYGGLGDAIFLYPIAKWFLSTRKTIQIETQFEDIFFELKKNKSFFLSKKISKPTICIEYKNSMHTDKSVFEDMCDLVGAPNLEFELQHPGGDSTPPFEKYCLIKPPYHKYDRHRDISPNPQSIQQSINLVKKHMPVVLLTHKDDVDYGFEGVEKIRVEKIANLIGLIKNSSLCISQTGHFQHLAESLSIPRLVIFSRKMKTSSIDYVKMLKPHKVIIKKSTQYIFDDEPNFTNELRRMYENRIDRRT